MVKRRLSTILIRTRRTHNVNRGLNRLAARTHRRIRLLNNNVNTRRLVRTEDLVTRLTRLTRSHRTEPHTQGQTRRVRADDRKFNTNIMKVIGSTNATLNTLSLLTIANSHRTSGNDVSLLKHRTRTVNGHNNLGNVEGKLRTKGNGRNVSHLAPTGVRHGSQATLIVGAGITNASLVVIQGTNRRRISADELNRHVTGRQHGIILTTRGRRQRVITNNTRALSGLNLDTNSILTTARGTSVENTSLTRSNGIKVNKLKRTLSLIRVIRTRLRRRSLNVNQDKGRHRQRASRIVRVTLNNPSAVTLNRRDNRRILNHHLTSKANGTGSRTTGLRTVHIHRARRGLLKVVNRRSNTSLILHRQSRLNLKLAHRRSNTNAQLSNAKDGVVTISIFAKGNSRGHPFLSLTQISGTPTTCPVNFSHRNSNPYYNHRIISNSLCRYDSPMGLGGTVNMLCPDTTGT